MIHIVIGCDREIGRHGMCAAQIRVFHADTLDRAIQAATAHGWSQTRTGNTECPRHGRGKLTNGPGIISATGQHQPL